MIPKKIHYCWFGGAPLSELAHKCIESWKKYLPDYEIIEWNENNYDINKNVYMAQAYEAKKYAFVSDYARFDILYQYGGIYFDIDVEVIRKIDSICEKGNWCGLEDKGAIAVGLGIASVSKNNIVLEILKSYDGVKFIKEDGSFNLYTVVDRVSVIFRKYGFTDRNEIQEIAGFTIYPVEYFCPKDNKTGIIKLTDNTYTIHHYDGSWVEEWRRNVQLFQYSCIKKIGNNLLSKLVYSSYHVYNAIKNLGLVRGIKYCLGDR